MVAACCRSTFRAVQRSSAFRSRRTPTRRTTRSGSTSSPRPVQEDKLVERYLGIAVPTREEMQEIEVTSRLYVENGARYMTATLMCQSDTDTPKTTAVTFILSGHRLVTVRYDDPRPFASSATSCAGSARRRDRRDGADGTARRRDRPRRRHSGADRRRRRPGLARHLRAGGSRDIKRAQLHGTSSRRSAARAT